MNTIHVSAEDVPLPAPEETLRDFADRVLRLLDKNQHELSILLCNNERIRRMNAEFRGKDEATDVLSFGQESTDDDFPVGVLILGDVVLAVPFIETQAAEYGVSFESEFKRMLIHGILHLSGVHHENETAERKMFEVQEKILSELEQEYGF